MRSLKGLGIKIDVWETPGCTFRLESGLVCAVQYALSLKSANGCSVFLLALLSVSGNTHAVSSACIVVGAVTVKPAENFVSPSPSPLLLRISIKKIIKSVSPHDSQFIQANSNVHQPFQVPHDCVRQIENEQQSTVGEVSQPLKVMALANGQAGACPDNAVPRLPGSDSWLSKKKQNKKNPELVRARLGAVKLHFRCCRSILDLVVNKHASISCLDHCSVGLVTRL